MKWTHRKLHYWVAFATALPVLLVILTGVLLQVKKDFAWIQPPEQKGSGKTPAVTLAAILEACRAVPEAGVQEWADIRRVDLRPSRGLVKVTTSGDWEVQIDAATGAVIHSAYRRSDLIENLHDGSWFGGVAKRWIFLPSGIALGVLWVTGIWLFLQPFLARRRAGRP